MPEAPDKPEEAPNKTHVVSSRNIISTGPLWLTQAAGCYCHFLSRRCTCGTFAISESSLIDFHLFHFIDGDDVCSFCHHPLVVILLTFHSNKWVLNVTTAPLFFLFAQFIIAVILFSLFHIFKIITLPMMRVDMPVLKGLASTVIYNVLALRYVFLFDAFGVPIHTTHSLNSTSNYSLKFVDASFYQVARGLVLPFTILTSYVMLHTRPSVRILLSCSVVTSGFFIGVFLDGTQVSGFGVLFGASSSLLSALHAAVMKRGFEVVDGSALSMSWYSNLLSAALLVPFIVILGEGPAVLDLLFGRAEGFWTFIIGSVATVSSACSTIRRTLDEISRFPGQCRLSALHR